MTILKPLGLTLAALTGALLALLTFAASRPRPRHRPKPCLAGRGPSGTASTILTIVALAVVALSATVYGYVALRRAYATEAPQGLRVLPGGSEPGEADDFRKAA